MSNVIDSRIVEMKFDNKQFESAVSTSMGTIAKLKESLNFDKSGSSFLSNLSGAINKLDFSPLAGAVDTVGAKFSAFETIAVGALMRIGQVAADTGMKLIKELSIDQLAEGWGKYEEKTTSVQTIMAATADQFSDTGEQMEYVNSQLEKLNWFTDETSYNFVDMVGNIGKFTSNGIALESAVTSMQGIANWAAISGQNAATASRAMYNLAQAIGTGSVKLIDWRSIENANMATKEFKQTVIDVAVAQGNLTKAADGTIRTLKGTAVSVQDFNSALSEGWFSKDVLTTVLDRYGSVTNELYKLAQSANTTATDILQLVEAQQKGTLSSEQLKSALGDDSILSVEKFRKAIEELASEENEFGIKAFKAAQEAKTFTDAIDATKDAVSTGWMKTFELMFGDYEHARVLWTDVANGLYDIFAAGSEARNELLKDWGNSKWENLRKDISAAGGSVASFEEKVTSGLKAQGVAVDTMIKEYGSLGAAIEAGAISSDKLSKAVRTSIDGIISGSTGSLESAEDKLKEIQDVVHQVWRGSLGNGEDRRKAIEELGYDYDMIQNLVAKGADYQLQLKDITDIELKALGLGEEEIAALRAIQADYERLGDLAGESGRQMFADSIINSLSAIEQFLRVIKSTWTDVFGEFTADALIDITRGIRDFTASLSLFETNSKGVEVLNERGESLVAVFQSIFDAGKKVLEFFKNIGRIIGQFAKAMAPAVSAARELGRALLELFSSVMGRVNVFLEKVDFSEKFSTMAEIVASAIQWITSKIDTLRVSFEKSKFGDAFSKIGDAADGVKTKVERLFQSSENGMRSAMSFENLLNKIGTALQKVKEFFQPVIDKLKEFWQALKGRFDFSNITSVGDAIHSVFSGIGGIASGAVRGLIDGIDRLDLSFGDLIKAFIGTKVAGKMLTNVLGGNGGSVKKSVADLIKSVKGIVDNFGEKGIIGALLGDVNLGSGKSAFDKFAENIKKIGSAMLMAAGGVLALGLALLVFNTAARMDPEGRGMLAMASAMSVMVLSLMALSIAGPKVALAGASMLAASVGVAALAGAMLLFNLAAKQDPEGKGMLAMAAAMTMLTAVLLALSIAGLRVIPAAAGLLIAASALIVMAGALALFNLVAKQDPEGNGMLLMAAALTALSIALAALGLVGPSVLVAASALLVASVALIAMAGALEAFTLIAKQGIDCVNGLILLAGALALVAGVIAVLGAIGPSVLVGAGALALAGVAVVAIAAGLAAAGVAIGIIGAGLTVLISGVGTAVGTAISAIGTGIGTALSAVGDGLGGIFSGIGEGIGEGIAAIGAGIATANSLIGVSVESLGSSIGNGFENIAAGIDGAALIVENAFDRLGAGIGSTVENFGAKIGSAIEGVGESIAKAGESIRGVGDSISSVGEGIKSFGEDVKGLGLIDLVGIGAGLIEFAKGVKKVNATAIKVDASGLISYVQAVSDLSSLVDSVNTIASQLEVRMHELGVNMGNNLSVGLASSTSVTVSSADSLAASAMYAANAYYDSFFVVGSNMAIGLANGIISESGTVSNAAASVASNAAQSARNAAKERSPSKVFADIGKYMSLGLANGISAEANSVADSAVNIAQTAVDSVKSLFDGGINNSEFTIKPVIDLSDAKAEASHLNNLFYNSDIPVHFGALNVGALMNGGEINKTASNRNISPDLETIFRKMESLADHIDNMQMVLDTGVLVGATSAKMDSQFGVMTMRRGRGN